MLLTKSTCIFSIKSCNDPIHPQLQIFMENGAKTQISLKFTDRDKIEFYFTGKSVFLCINTINDIRTEEQEIVVIIIMPTLTVSATI